MRSILQGSNLILNKDFYVGYSLERINPVISCIHLKKLIRLLVAPNAESLKFIYDLYARVIKADVFAAASIKVAEASKVIENIKEI